ncbi:hypothetical protein ACFYN0_26565 [Streptomyces sp. NPDC006704]|uniref:hypothetical protein n=1 Tax=Streptomyces sp. NPDC006704 TaxID=3364760 RepID=UPI0036955993
MPEFSGKVDWKDLFGMTDDQEVVRVAAARIYNVLNSMGVELSNIDIIDPCDNCYRKSSRISLGIYDVSDVDEMSEKAEEFLQELESG